MEATTSTKAPETHEPAAALPVAVLVVGVAALLLSVVGPALVVSYYGWSPPAAISRALKSDTTAVVLIVSALVGLVAVVAGFATYGRMPTRRRRNQALSGAFFGVHALTVAAFLLWFRTGEVLVLTKNFLDFQVLEGSLTLFLRGAKNTVTLAFLGELGGIVLGLILSILTLANLKVVRAPARMYINFFRGTPLLWQLITFYFGITLGLRLHLSAFQVALLVFVLNSAAYIAEIFRAGIQSIERGQMEAARSMGMTYLQAMRYAIVPQALRRVIPPLMNEFVALIKDTSLIAVLGLAVTERDLLAVANAQYSLTFDGTFLVAVAFLYLVITLPLIGAVNWLERKLRSGLVGVAGAGTV